MGIKAREERSAKLQRIKEQLAKLEEWICPICTATNSGLSESCENIVKSGGKVVSAPSRSPAVHRVRKRP